MEKQNTNCISGYFVVNSVTRVVLPRYIDMIFYITIAI